MADEFTPLISKEDIQNLVIEKKFVRIDSNKYTQEAYEYIKELIDAERAILFDRSTHRIWTLGEWFGGDVFKENLLYYSKLKVIDLNNDILNEIEAIGPESTLSYKGKNNIQINAIHDEENKQDVIEIELDVYNLIKKQLNNKYYLFIDEEGHIGIKEYKKPIIEIIKQDYVPEQISIDIEFNVESSVPIQEWKKFEITTKNCDLYLVDLENNIIKLDINPNNYINDIEEVIEIEYDDGYTQDKIVYNGIFNVYCYYGCYDQNNFQYIDLGNYIIDNGHINNIFTINQQNIYYGYFRCPLKYDLIFIDNIRYSQGAWKEEFNVTINNIQYKTYITENAGLGNIEWKVLENIK